VTFPRTEAEILAAAKERAAQRERGDLQAFREVVLSLAF
jgi:hypothetical protein